MPRTKSSNIVKRPSSSGPTEAGKRETTEMEPATSSSPKPQDTPARQVPAQQKTGPGQRPYRMKLLPTPCGNPNRYKDYSPEPEGRSVGGSASGSVGGNIGGSAGRNVGESVGSQAVAGGSGLGQTRERSSRTRRTQSGGDRCRRIPESPDRSAAAKCYSGDKRLRKFEKMRDIRRKKPAGRASKKEKRSASGSSVDSAVNSSDGNNADSSSSEPELPKRSKRVK